MSTMILTMAGAAVTTAVAEKVCNAFGKQDLGQMVSIGGLSLVGVSAVGLTVKLLYACKNLF